MENGLGSSNAHSRDTESARQETVSDFEETSVDLGSLGNKGAISSHVVVFVEHSLTRDDHVGEY